MSLATTGGTSEFLILVSEKLSGLAGYKQNRTCQKKNHMQKNYTVSIPKMLFEDENLRLSDLGIYAAARSFAKNGRGECWASLRGIAKRAHCDHHTVARSLERLEAGKYIVVTGRQRSWRGGKESLKFMFPVIELGHNSPTKLELGEKSLELGENAPKRVKEELNQNKLNLSEQSLDKSRENSGIDDEDNRMVEEDQEVVSPLSIADVTRPTSGRRLSPEEVEEQNKKAEDIPW